MQKNTVQNLAEGILNQDVCAFETAACGRTVVLFPGVKKISKSWFK